MKLLLDTCALLHFSLNPDRLSSEAISQITEPKTEVWCSPISIGELACLQERGRIEITGHWKTWFRTLLQTNGWNLLPITGEIVEEAWSLLEPIHRDPADRILIASARVHRMTLVTTDQLILDYPHVEALS
ncbi:MAG: type II toxin-antitoxin system VapC family toxin [Verrucomicrobiota bacterium]